MRNGTTGHPPATPVGVGVTGGWLGNLCASTQKYVVVGLDA